MTNVNRPAEVVIEGKATALTISSRVIERLGLVIAGSFLLFTAASLSSFANTTDHTLLVVSLFLYVLAFGLLILGAAKVQVKYADALILLGVLASLFAIYYLVFSEDPRDYIADNLAFAHTSAEMVLKGENPYAVKDREALEQSAQNSGLASFFITKQPDGQIVDRLIVYPAGMFMVYVVPVELGLHDMRWLSAIAALLALVVLWWQAPRVLRPLACLPIIVSADAALLETIGGISDSIWLLPLLLCVIALNRRRYDAAALAFGVSIAIKQQPWLLIPFIAIWLWYESRDLPTRGRVSTIGRFFAIGGAVFLAVNLPFMVWDLRAWLEAVTWQFWSSQVFNGTGLSALTSSGTVHIGRSVYTALGLIAAVVLLIAYARYYDVLKHAVWLFPGIVLWFGYRSLNNYFIYWVPLIVVSLFAMWQEEQKSGEGPLTPELQARGDSEVQ